MSAHQIAEHATYSWNEGNTVEDVGLLGMKVYLASHIILVLV